MKSHQSSDPQPLSLIRRLAVAALLGIGLFYTIRAVTPDAVATGPASASGQLSTPISATHAAAFAQSADAVNPSPSVRLVTKNIEDIRLGQRVVGTNPLREQTKSASDIDPATWRTVRLKMTQHGVDYDLAFLRPLHWIETTGAAVGRSIHMELHEMGLDGQAKVVGIDACPQIETDDGTGRNVVTGTMAHPGANILYLDVTGLDEPLGVTDTHPIWSETRQDFVVAGQLQVEEQFRTLTGESATLTKIHPHRGPPELVFNLEVDGEHVYSVAGNGLLVHNDCGTSTAIGRMEDLVRFDADDAVDTWRKSGRIPGPDDLPVTIAENKAWLRQRFDRGDSFLLATDPSNLSSVRVPGVGNGYYTFLELKWLKQWGANVDDAF